MSTLRIQGLVRLAEQVRRDLARLITEDDLAQIRKTVDASLNQVRQICEAHDVTPDALPAPSRRAYYYLAAVDWSQVVTGEAHAPDPPRQLRFRGVHKRLEEFQASLSRPQPAQAETVFERIVNLSARIERSIEQEGLTPDQLTEPTRQARGWLGLFAQRAYFERYLEAVAVAVPIMGKMIGDVDHLHGPAHIHFQPMSPPAKRAHCGRRSCIRLVPTQTMVCVARTKTSAML